MTSELSRLERAFRTTDGIAARGERREAAIGAAMQAFEA